MSRMDGKIVVVTGGTQGLGAATARLLAERGAAGIVICGRGTGKGEAQAEMIGQATGTAMLYVKADLEQVADCRAVIAAADRRFGRLDSLINVAAITDRGTILDTSPALFDRMFAINVRAPFFLMQDAISLMRRDGVHGTIVNVSSMSSMGGQSFLAAYSASKGALDTLTRNTAHALLRNRIRVNGLNLGWMASEGEDRIQREHHGQTDGWLEQAAAAQPSGRLIDPAEAARAIAFMASDESGLMTGTTMGFDQSVWGAYDQSPHPADPL